MKPYPTWPTAALPISKIDMKSSALMALRTHTLREEIIETLGLDLPGLRLSHPSCRYPDVLMHSLVNHLLDDLRPFRRITDNTGRPRINQFRRCPHRRRIQYHGSRRLGLSVAPGARLWERR